MLSEFFTVDVTSYLKLQSLGLIWMIQLVKVGTNN